MFRNIRQRAEQRAHSASDLSSAAPPAPLSPSASVDRKDPGTLAWQSAADGSPSGVFEALVDGGRALLFALNENGQSLLHVAAERGHLEVVNLLLLHRDVDLNLGDASSRTPLHAARVLRMPRCWTRRW